MGRKTSKNEVKSHLQFTIGEGNAGKRKREEKLVGGVLNKCIFECSLSRRSRSSSTRAHYNEALLSF